MGFQAQHITAQPKVRLQILLSRRRILNPPEKKNKKKNFESLISVGSND
jgi:hypothetical protein